MTSCLESRIRTLFQKQFLLKWCVNVLYKARTSSFFIFSSMFEVTPFSKIFIFKFFMWIWIRSIKSIKYKRLDYWAIIFSLLIWSGLCYHQIAKLLWLYLSMLVSWLHAMANPKCFALTGGTISFCMTTNYNLWADKSWKKLLGTFVRNWW